MRILLKRRSGIGMGAIAASGIAPFFAFAHSAADGAVRFNESAVKETSIDSAIAAAVVIAALVCLALFVRDASERFKTAVFSLIVAAAIIPTAYFVGGTLYLNAVSATGGPVHWHADFRIFSCGSEIELERPRGLSNKVGTAVFHHHGDKRIHVEGAVADLKSISLHEFFDVIGGSLADGDIAIPSTAGVVRQQNGDSCPDGTAGVWNVFVYQAFSADPTIIERRRLDSYAEYILSPHTVVPPGDCVIFEFGAPQTTTARLCALHEVARENGEIEIR